MNTTKLKKHLALLLVSILAFAQTVEAATVTLATSPLANVTTSVVHPNIMFVLDNSGSMAWDYLPDYVSSGSSGTGSSICWNGINDSNTRATCSAVGSTGSDVVVPFTTSDVNYIYYNPAIHYSPPFKADKTSYPNSPVTAAYTNGFAATGSTNFQTATTVATLAGTWSSGSTTVTLASSEGLLGTYVSGSGNIPANTYVAAIVDATHITLSQATTAAGAAVNLTFKSGNYKHQVYCNIGGPTEQNKRGNGTVCKETTDTTDHSSLYPTGAFTTVTSYNGPAYYYTMSPLEYCTDSFLTNCQTAADATHAVPALYRWCSTYTAATVGVAGTFNSCQDIRDQSHTIPDYLGSFVPSTAGAQAYADLIVSANPTPGLSITGLTVNGVGIIAAGNLPITVTSGNTATDVAKAICTAIHNDTGFSGYDCPTTPGTGTLRIVANSIGSAPNGFVVAVLGPAPIGGVKASGTITINSTAGATKIDDITVGGTSVMTTKPWYFPDGTDTTNIATKLATLIGNGYTATSAGNIITITSTSFGTNTSAVALSASAVSAKATITATAAVGAGANGSIGAISSNGTTIQAAQTFAASTGANAVASQIAGGTFQNSFSGTSSSNVVTVTAPPGNAFNNKAISIPGGTVSAGTHSSGTVTITDSNNTVGVGTSKHINSLKCPSGGTNTITTNTVSSGSSGLIGNLTAGLVANGINSYAFSACSAAAPAVPPPAQSASCTVTGPVGGAACTLSASLDSSPGFSVSGSLSAGTLATVNYSPNLTVGTFAAAANPAITGSFNATLNAGYAAQGATGSLLGSVTTGVTPAGPIATNAPTAMANGLDTVATGRQKVGVFKRVDIVPSTTSYAKASGRDDCAGATCTYAEELQNFANWYSYYRTRLLMMKSASTISFNNLDSKFRVGFDLLSHNNSGAVDLEVAQFVDSGGETANQRTNWWNNLTNAATSGSTPLRTEVNKIGKYYAGKLTSSAATPAVAETSAKGTISISSANNGAVVTSIKVEGVEILGAPLTAACASTPCSSTQRTTFATNIKNQINTFVGGATYAAFVCKGNDGVTTVPCPAYVATSSGGTVTVTAPPVTVATDPSTPTVNGQGTYFNGNVVTFSKSGTITLSTADFSGGVDSKPSQPATTFAPIQYSCQQNYTLLVTDGYWNSDVHANLTLLTGNPEIGNQDNVLFDVNNHPDGVIRGQYDGELTSTTCDDTTFSSCGTLSDVTMYYYKTDLRDASLNNATNAATGVDVATNNVFVSPNDDNKKQHMVFFGMGLGAPGTLRYRTDYLTALSGDYFDIVAGTKNWPAPKANDPTTIDDLWHATVNGHGKYFSARDPVSASNGLKDALTSITARVGSAAAAATSNLKPVSGDNFAYVASYETVSWVGDVQARTINLVTGAVNNGLDANNNSTCGQPLDANGQGCPWSAQVLLDAKTFSARSIYIAPATGVSLDPLRLFDFVNLTGAEQAFFDPSTLNQFASANTSYPGDVTAANLVNFLRGDRSMEANGVPTQKQIWRKRDHVLGDIVNTQPAFVKKPTFSYLDPGYSTFASGPAASRQGMLYISANDGMLHALNSDTGQEQWTFIPKEVLPSMKVLADSNYAHHYFVDGQISVGDVNFGGGASDWHTILVAGLGGGGKEFFALDITDPATPPVFLWEFTTANDANLGFSFGDASINKLPNGEWAVFFTSGYNNADGKGYLYAVDPKTGTLKTGFPMTTGAGTPTSPSNLGKISAWVTDVRTDNTAEFFYGGDMDGNVWRFDLNVGSTGHTSTPVFKLAQLKNASGQVQPITTKLELTKIGTTPLIFVGTGQYLSTADLTDTTVQSLYAIKDTLGVPNLGGASQATWHPRDDTGTVNGVPNTHLFLSRTITDSTDSNGNVVRIVCDTTALQPNGTCGTGVTLDYVDYGGWYTDFPDSGERVNVDMNLTLGTLTFPTNVPDSSACNSGGFSFINFVDFKTGLAIPAQNDVTGQPIMGREVAGALTVGINVVQLPGGSLAAIVTTSDYRNVTINPAFSSETFTGHRDFWRELQVY